MYPSQIRLISATETPGFMASFAAATQPLAAYYISYLYDHSMMLPVKIKGKPVGNLKAEIVENNWGPYQALKSTLFAVFCKKGAFSVKVSENFCTLLKI